MQAYRFDLPTQDFPAMTQKHPDGPGDRIHPSADPAGPGEEQVDSLFDEAMKEPRSRLLDATNKPEYLLATADTSGNPSLQDIAIYDVDEKGIQFFTNGHSRRASHLQENSQAAISCRLTSSRELLLVEGETETLGRSLLRQWWETRPREEQLLAWASNQSAPLDSLATLERRVAQCRTQFVDGIMPPPPHWMGFRLVPSRFEFCRPGPRHIPERICYARGGRGWTRNLLNP